MSTPAIIVVLVVAAVVAVVLVIAEGGRQRRRIIREAILKELRRKSLETFSLEEFAREMNAPIADAKRVARGIYSDFYRKCASDGVLTEAERNDLALLADRIGMNEIEVRHVEQRLSEGLYRPILGGQAAAFALPDAELRTLQALRNSLRLPGRSAVQALERRAIEVYRKKFSDFASDGVLDDEEIEKLQTLADQIGLDQAQALDVIKEDALRLIHRVYAFARQDRVISEGEEAEIVRMQKVLNIADDEIVHIKDEIAMLRRGMEIRRGTLPGATSPLAIPDGESCHWAGACTYRNGDEKREGQVVLTNEKLYFASGDEPEFNVPFKEIEDVIELPDGFELKCRSKEAAGSYAIADGRIVLEMVLFLAESHGVDVQRFEAEAGRDVPHDVKLRVWERDMARCTQCSATDQIEFRYITPVSEGGEAVADNIKLVCRKCLGKALKGD